MAMNYIGAISILDRGDAPAQAVIDRNARSLAQRVSDETKDELNKVMTRVHNIYENLDTVEEVYMGPSMEYLNDLAELEEILKDEIKKRQYQQQVTVFIVGYSDVCHQKLRLLQQVNEFFMENSKRIDDEDWFPTTPDMDMEEISNNIEDSLAHAHALTNRLGDLNREMVDYVAALAEKKASSKGKKKIEKALLQAREDVSGLNEKLLALQKDLEEKEEKVQGLFKQLDQKTLEAQKFKTAAELGKKAADEIELLTKEIAARDAKIIAQRSQISHLEVEIVQSRHMKDRTETKYSQSDEERQHKITTLQKELDDEKLNHEETKSNLTKLLDNQINAMHESHRQEMEDLKKQHESQAKTLQDELSALQKELNLSEHHLATLRIEQNTETPSEAPRYLDLDSESSQQASRQSSKQESRPSTKDTRASGASRAGGGASRGKGGANRSPTRSKDGKSAGKASTGRPDKEYAEIAIQDEGGDPSAATVDEKSRTPATRLGLRSKSNLAPVLESDLDTAFDLFDDQAWAGVSKDEVPGRFAQYRRLSTNKIQELEDQLSFITAKTRRKVQTLKAQFTEHKTKWETERKVLIEQVDQSIKLQSDAEMEADAAMTQLEDFITEQEKLEQDEEVQRAEILNASASLTPQSNAALTPTQARSANHSPSATASQQRGATLTPDAEGELQRLMQQTDDAKVQEMNARLASTTSDSPVKDTAEATDEVTDSTTDKAVTSETAEVAGDDHQGEITIKTVTPPQVESGNEVTEAPQDGGKEEDVTTKGSEEAKQEEGVALPKTLVSESITSLEGADEEVRASSAMSRASLREQYKAKLEEAKQAAEDRRSKSPHISLPTKMTVDDELIDDEDDEFYLEDGDMPIADYLKEELRDPSMYEIGTSPPPNLVKTSRDPTQISKDPTRLSKATTRDPNDLHKEPTGPYREPSKPGRDPTVPMIQKFYRKGTSLLEHPLLKEYLKAYESVVGFKEGMSKMFLDKDMMSAHQMTSDLETLTFDHGQKVMPQIEELTSNIAYVLEELASLTNNILVYDREPPVSSLHLISREPTQRSFPAFGEGGVSSSNQLPVAPPATQQDARRSGSQSSSHHSGEVHNKGKGHRSSADISADKARLAELEDYYSQLKLQLEDNGKQHQEQLQRNTVVMMEMQDTINELQRELSALGKNAKQSKSRLSSGRGSAVHHKSPSPETSVMFTRLDSERNAKIMKKAVMDDKLNPEKYKEAVAKMDEYVTLPAQRLAHLVKKYIHHTRMRVIEEKVKNSASVDEEVFEVLDKMEDLQNRRARQWADRMDEMGIERLKLANLLMDSLDTIEQESGIFLIKPMYSYRGRDVKPGGHAGKLSRPVRVHTRVGTGHQRHMTPTNDGASSFVPAPTPASNYRLVRHERHFLQQQQQQQVPVTMAEMKPAEPRASKDDGLVQIMGSGMTFSAGSPRTTWNMQASQPWLGKDDPSNMFNTPRILELDVNRMLLGQNNITSKVPFPPTDDRLLNASNNTLRSYVTVNRPTAPLAGAGDRPTSAGSSKGSARRAKVSQVDKEIPQALPIPNPLPPISSISGEGDDEYNDEDEEEETKAPSVEFSDGEVEDEGTEPPHSPPGSSLYHSVVTKNEDDDNDDDDQHADKEDTTLTQDL